MNCRGCGTELAHEPSLDTVNQAVDEVLQKSIEDAVQTGGVCLLCGNSHCVPVSHRKSVQFALLAGCLLLLGLVLAATLVPGQEALRRAPQATWQSTLLSQGLPLRVFS